jgi:hypothetical protein
MINEVSHELGHRKLVEVAHDPHNRVQDNQDNRDRE